MKAYTQDIKTKLENGQNFENNASGWYTINKPEENTRAICFCGDEMTYKFYKNFDSYAIRVGQLMNTGR